MTPEKEEIIELTEVWEEPSSQEQPPSAADGPEMLRKDFAQEIEKIPAALKERVEKWLVTDGVQVINQGIREIVPPIFGEELNRELEKLKSEVEKIRVLKEELRVKIKDWLDSEGSQLLKKETKEMLPKIGEDLLGKEINQLQEEVEKIRGLRASLNSKAEQWLQTEGIFILQEKAAEVMNQIAPPLVAQELAKLREEKERIKGQEESWPTKLESWLNKEGTRILENKVQEIFPGIAVEVLKKEIAKLKEETEEKE